MDRAGAIGQKVAAGAEGGLRMADGIKQVSLG
jgi:hypothetical protein